MITSSNFDSTVQFLDNLSLTQRFESPAFTGEYQALHPLKAAVQLIHLTSTEGTNAQKDVLYSRRKQIKKLNQLLKSPEDLQKWCNVSKEVDVTGMQVTLPKNKFQRMMSSACKIPGFALAILGDIAMLPGAGLLILFEKLKKDFNPKQTQVRKDKTPILLLHGSGFCQAQWAVTRLFLKGKDFGSVFSCSYAEGLISNDRESSISKYSAEKVREQIQKIKTMTGQNKIILIGHSMGTLVGEDYAQQYAQQDGIEVTNVLSISTPWQGSPTIDLFRLKARRYQEMSVSSGDIKSLQFRRQLQIKAKQADNEGKRLQWNMWSQHDPAVPGKSGRLTEDPRRQYEVSMVGHYFPMVHLKMMLKMRSWVKRMYAMET